MRIRVRGLAISLLSLLTAAGAASAETTSAPPTGPTERLIADTSAERAAYGLPGDRETVYSLLTSGQDVGSAQWGVAMTAAEEQVVNFPGRMEFMSQAHARLIPYVESLDTYAGYYVDQRNGIAITVGLTARDDAIEAAILALAPGGGEVATRLVHNSQARLEAAHSLLPAVWAAQLPDESLYGSSIDTIANGVTVYVDSHRLDHVRAYS